MNVDTLRGVLPLLGNLPFLLACSGALVVVLSQGQRVRGAVPWALSGFGLSLVLGIVMPITYAFLPSYLTTSRAMSPKEVGTVLSFIALVSSLLHALSVVFLLVAVLAGRPRTDVPPPLPPV